MLDVVLFVLLVVAGLTFARVVRRRCPPGHITWVIIDLALTPYWAIVALTDDSRFWIIFSTLLCALFARELLDDFHLWVQTQVPKET